MSQPMGTSREMVEFDVSSNSVDQNSGQISTQLDGDRCWRILLSSTPVAFLKLFFSRLLSVDGSFRDIRAQRVGWEPCLFTNTLVPDTHAVGHPSRVGIAGAFVTVMNLNLQDPTYCPIEASRDDCSTNVLSKQPASRVHSSLTFQCKSTREYFLISLMEDSIHGTLD